MTYRFVLRLLMPSHVWLLRLIVVSAQHRDLIACPTTTCTNDLQQSYHFCMQELHSLFHHRITSQQTLPGKTVAKLKIIYYSLW
jgi:hypothetical protein